MDNLVHDPNSPDKYWKVRPIMDKFQERIALEKPESMLSVDEQMVPFRGKKIPKGLRQYMKGKPTPWGIKFYFLCGVSGSPYFFIPYQGQTTPLPEEFKPYGIGGSVVLYLVTTRIPENSLSSLFTDRFFTSPPLVKKLLDYGVYTTGTTNTNRIGNAPIINNKDISKKPRGYMYGCLAKDGSQCLVKWKDSSNVCLLSSAYPFHETKQVQRYDKKKSPIYQYQLPI